MENWVVAYDSSLTSSEGDQPATDVLVWDAWGESRNGQLAKRGGQGYDYQYTAQNDPYVTNDPAGFEAQYGYQGEWDPGLFQSWR